MGWLKDKTGTLFSKTVLGMLSVSLTVLIAAIIVLFSWFRAQMAEGYRELTYEAMANTDTVFSGRLTDAKNRITEWYTSPDGICLRLKENTPFTEHMSFINKILSTLNGNSFMQSVCFVNTGKSISLTVGSNVSHPEDLEESLLSQLENVGNGNRIFFWNAKDSFSDDTIPIMSVSMAENAMGDLRFSGMSVINIDLRQFNKSLFSGRKQGQFRLIVLDREGVVVCNSDLTNLGEDWSQKEWVQRILGGETQFDVKEEGKRWEIQAALSGEDGFYMVAQSEYVARIVNVNYILYMVLAVILVAAATIVVMTMLVSRRIFQPFRTMVGNLKQSPMMDELEEERDEVAFLEHFYEGISTNLRTLNDRKENDFIVKNLLLGNQRKEIKLLMQQKEILAEDVPYYMLLVLVESCDSKENFSMQEYDMLRSMSGSVFCSALEKYGRCTCLEVGLRRMLFIISGISNIRPESERILEAVKRAELSLKKLSQIRIYSLLSEALVDGGETCVACFTRLNDCLKTRHLLEREDTLVIGIEEEHIKDEIPEELLLSLKQRDKAGFMEVLRHVLAECETMPWSAFSDRIAKVASVIVKAGRMKQTEKRNSEEMMKSRVAAMKEREELLLWLESLYDEAAIQISKVSSHSTASMMEEAVDYIRNNYDDCNLNVNQLAERLNISTAYFGQLFAEFTGLRTLDYILHIRMEKARDILLSEPGTDISQVASAVGYGSSTYFTTAFKKFYGVTPSRFRDYHAAAERRVEDAENNGM